MNKGVRKIYRTKDIILTGFALFAMLFGAGNLIFPPTVGYIVGDNWKLAAFGFCITGIGFPLMGIIASGFAGTELDHFSDRVSPLFSRIFLGSHPRLGQVPPQRFSSMIKTFFPAFFNP